MGTDGGPGGGLQLTGGLLGNGLTGSGGVWRVSGLAGSRLAGSGLLAPDWRGTATGLAGAATGLMGLDWRAIGGLTVTGWGWR